MRKMVRVKNKPDFLVKSPTPEPGAARSENPTTFVPLPKTEPESVRPTAAEDEDGGWAAIAEMLPNTAGGCPTFFHAN